LLRRVRSDTLADAIVYRSAGHARRPRREPRRLAYSRGRAGANRPGAVSRSRAISRPRAIDGTDKPHAARTRGGDITKAEYIERAVDRAKRAAEKRFDKLDANHDGVLSADERGAARAARSKRKSSSE
jgi:hypothetical protein